MSRGLSLPSEARRLDSIPLSDHVYRALRDAILEGVYEPHDHLVQIQLAKELDVSRTPVRDALQRLSQEGIIRSVGARGYVVSSLTPRDILDVYDVRLALEVEAAIIAVETNLVTDHDLAEMKRLTDLMAQNETQTTSYYDLNRDFHMVLTRICPNRMIHKILDDIWALPVSMRIFRHEIESVIDVKAMLSEHYGIIEAVTKKDSDLLRQRLREHLVQARDEASTWLDRKASSALNSDVK
jgi:DNA-binding GntR family transcriptional regulator